MVRKYERKVGSRPYRNFSEEALAEAISKYKKGNLMQLSKQYNIPYVTLYRKINKLHMNKPGHSTALSQNDEETLVHIICIASEWGFPFEAEDVKDLVESYINGKGIQVKEFSNNRPGEGWLEKFLRRHGKQLSKRTSQSIKQSRAKVDYTIINSYFDNLSKSLENVTPDSIINYDETNFTDDPGRTKVIVRRQCKRAEKILDTSKAATSVMFACSASGVLLPPYIVYKSDNLWQTWTENGPPKARYNRSRSGWFDTSLFEDWFLQIALPYFRALPPGRRALIGDNLASHISSEVVKQCEENNISFILLPPNSTHMTQPLDVSVFQPLKAKWRQILRDWKKSKKGVISKDVFPRLLKQCLDSIAANNEKNIKSGFEATGIVPQNRNKVLQKLPIVKDDAAVAGAENAMGEALQKLFKEARFGKPGQSSGGRRKKLCVAPGASVSHDELEKTLTVSEPKTKRKPKRKKPEFPQSSDSEEDILPPTLRETATIWNEPDNSDTDPDIYSESSNDETEIPKKAAEKEAELPESLSAEQPKAGDYIFARMETETGTFKEYVTKILSVEENNSYLCTFLRSSLKVKNSFIYPDIEDIALVKKNEIKKVLTVKSILRRGQIVFNEHTF